jgi:hypothetical protein
MPTLAPDVDENGNPETPLGQATEKKKNKNLTLAALAVGGIGVAITIYMRNKNAAATAAGTTTAGYSYPTLTPGTTAAPVDNTGLIDAFNQGISALSQQIAGQTNTPVSASGATAPPAGSPPALSAMTLTGSGYIPTADWGPTPGSVLPNPEYSTTGQVYTPLAGAGLSAVASSGQTLFYQPTPGVFNPYSGTTVIAPGTPLFQKQA